MDAKPYYEELENIGSGLRAHSRSLKRQKEVINDRQLATLQLFEERLHTAINNIRTARQRNLH